MEESNSNSSLNKRSVISLEQYTSMYIFLDQILEGLKPSPTPEDVAPLQRSIYAENATERTNANLILPGKRTWRENSRRTIDRTDDHSIERLRCKGSAS